MNKYIKINDNNEITDVFFEYQQNKFDGSEILIGDAAIKHKINNNSIANEYGVLVYIWNGTSATKKTAAAINNDADFLIRYKLMKKDELERYIGSNLLTVVKTDRTLQDIIIQWDAFKSGASSWNTKAAVDTAFNNAISWLNS